MSKLLKLLSQFPWRTTLHQKRFFAEGGNDFRRLRGMSTQASASTARPNFTADGTSKIFAPYSIFKGKAALSSSPVLPAFVKTESGSVKVDRRGCILLTFWPAVGERKYDWEKRQVFALSATEVGSLINLGSKDSCEFFHDPSLLSSNAGKVRKSLSIKAHADGSGYFISLNVVNNNLKSNDRFVVPVTAAEFAVMRTAFSFALPHILGWGRCADQLPRNTYEKQPQRVSELVASEWDR